MKSLVFVFVLAVAVLSLPAMAGEPSAAENSFATMKALAGTWQGRVTTDPPTPEADNKAVEVSLRVTSMGNALVHEMTLEGRPDHPVTMFYVDDNRLMLTHYCDAGNRPRMTARTPTQGKTVEFDFLDLSGGNEHGHMHHALFTVLNRDRHSEDWTYMGPGNTPVRAHLDLERTK